MKLLIDEREDTYLVFEGKDFHTKYGFVKADDLKNAKPGDMVESNMGRRFHVIEPDVSDFMRKAMRGPQAVMQKDAAIIAGYACLRSGSRVVEAGAGSGVLSIYLSYVIYPEKLVSYEIREDFAEIAKANFSKYKIENVELKLKDIYEGIDEKELDAVVLDLTEPWKAVEHARKALKVGGYLISYSPSINQSRQLAEKLSGFRYETFECILRNWKEESMRPDTRMIGHTGFITVARILSR